MTWPEYKLSLCKRALLVISKCQFGHLDESSGVDNMLKECKGARLAQRTPRRCWDCGKVAQVRIQQNAFRDSGKNLEFIVVVFQPIPKRGMTRETILFWESESKISLPQTEKEKCFCKGKVSLFLSLSHKHTLTLSLTHAHTHSLYFISRSLTNTLTLSLSLSSLKLKLSLHCVELKSFAHLSTDFLQGPGFVSNVNQRVKRFSCSQEATK